MQRDAIVRTDNDDRKLSRYLYLLRHCLCHRYSEIEVESDSEEAVLLLQEAVDITPEELSHRLSELHSLTGVIDELQTAIGHASEAVDITLGGDQAEALYCLGLHPAAKYKKTGESADVDEAIRITRVAVESTVKLQNKPQYPKHIALYPQDKYEKIRQMTYLNEAV